MQMLQRLSAATILALSAFGSLTGIAFAETRVALIIGNGAYQNAPRLPNPSNDAADVAASLKRSGFATVLATDLDKTAMDAATITFARAARTADVAMFYYSGHAMQFGGVNYLVPVDAKLTDEADLRRMVRVDEVVSDLQQAKNLRILVLDSCRDNPLAEELKRSIGTTRALPLQRGLARIDSPQGMIVAYATQSGRTAEDGSGRNSPYTAAFIRNIEAQEEIGTIFRRISADVYETTRHGQLPELSLSLIGEFYLRGKSQMPPPVDSCSGAESHWKSAESIGSAEAYRDHLARFPNCAFAGLAKARVNALAALGTATSQQPTRMPAGPSGNPENGNPARPASAGDVTFDTTKPGGLTSEQIVRRLNDNDKFSGSIGEPPREGSMLPGVYGFSRGTSRDEVIRQMQAAQARLLAEIWDHRSADLPVRAPEQLVTLASIVELETGRDDERSRIAAVFVNRLRQKMKLQSDPTLVYGLVGGAGTLGRPIKRSEIQQASPYNTYMVDGLPPGPIGNPSRASLEAAANPARTRDLFFVGDGVGGHAFTETYDQHRKNVAKLRLPETQNDTVEPPANDPPSIRRR
jgi:hypothetical protein